MQPSLDFETLKQMKDKLFRAVLIQVLMILLFIALVLHGLKHGEWSLSMVEFGLLSLLIFNSIILFRFASVYRRSKKLYQNIIEKYDHDNE